MRTFTDILHSIVDQIWVKKQRGGKTHEAEEAAVISLVFLASEVFSSEAL